LSEKPRKTRAKAVKKEKPAPTKPSARVVWTRPTGAPPAAMVRTRHSRGMIQRAGRGFSYGELSAASLSPQLARRWGVKTDVLRGSTLEPNVSVLRKWFDGAKKSEVSVREPSEKKAVKKRVVRKKKASA